MGRKFLKGLFILALIGIYGIAAIIPTFGYLITLSIATYFIMNGILLLADKVFDKEKDICENKFDDCDECEEEDLDYCDYCGHIREFCTCDEEEV